jgi:hypothetical protein
MLNPMQVLTFAPCQDDIRAVKVYVHFPPKKRRSMLGRISRKSWPGNWKLGVEAPCRPQRHSELYLLLFEPGPTRLFAAVGLGDTNRATCGIRVGPPRLLY